jgi:hypothetical protein
VGRFDHIAVEVVISKYRAADGCDTNGGIFNAELVDNLGYKTVDNTVGTAGAVVKGCIC